MAAATKPTPFALTRLRRKSKFLSPCVHANFATNDNFERFSGASNPLPSQCARVYAIMSYSTDPSPSFYNDPITGQDYTTIFPNTTINFYNAAWSFSLGSYTSGTPWKDVVDALMAGDGSLYSSLSLNFDDAVWLGLQKHGSPANITRKNCGDFKDPTAVGWALDSNGNWLNKAGNAGSTHTKSDGIAKCT